MRADTIQFRGGIAYHWGAVRATVRMHLQWSGAHALSGIQLVLFPLLSYLTWRVTYAVSGRAMVGGVSSSAFLLVGMVGLLTWQATVKGSGSSIQYERNVGTIGALFLTPVSRAATVVGHGLAAFVELLPSYAVIVIIGFVTGAQVDVTDPLAIMLALLALVVASLATGFAFAGLFILSRRGNLIANVLQSPIYLLAGFIVPRASLPWWLHPLSDIIPAGPATDALRASTLSGASLGGIARNLALAFATSALWALIGYVSLRRVEYAAKRSGQLELY
jgi:ABC-2 type transport system permease protein